jgi:predicted nuclease of predicted toxin-antitoxin system
MKLLVDMNLSPRWVNLLAEAGIDAVHWSALGSAALTEIGPLPKTRRCSRMIRLQRNLGDVETKPANSPKTLART